MFALLFDRKSLTMTLLALGGMGLLLFVSGFALGSYLNGGLEHLGVVSQEASFTGRPAASSDLLPPVSRRGSRSTISPAAVEETLEIEEPASPQATGAPGEPRVSEAEPPADWVPLEDGGVWPGDGLGEEPGQEEATEETLTVEPAHTQVAEAETASPAVQAAAQRPQGFYYVQLGTYSREEIALEKRAEVESRIAAEDAGVAPFLTPVTDRGGREVFAVRVGPFPTRRAAREAAAGFGRASIVWSPAGRAL